jgi:hypothetical protein
MHTRERVRNRERERERRQRQQAKRTDAARRYRAMQAEIMTERLGFVPRGCEWTVTVAGGKLRKHLCPLLACCKILQTDDEVELPCEMPDDLVDIPVRQVRDGWIDELHEPLRDNVFQWRDTPFGEAAA